MRWGCCGCWGGGSFFFFIRRSVFLFVFLSVFFRKREYLAAMARGRVWVADVFVFVFFVVLEGICFLSVSAFSWDVG